MLFTMTTKRILYCFILITYCCSAFAQVGDRCTVKANGLPGTCQISANCPVVKEQAQNGISPTICGYYQLTAPIVCCETNSFTTPKDEPVNPESSNSREPNPITLLIHETNNPDALVYPEDTERPPVPQHRVRKSEQKCEEYNKNITTATVSALPLLTAPHVAHRDVVQCAHNGIPLIVGGTPATPGEFPFMAAIGFPGDDKIEWLCGGTLISLEYVLTAAHCTFSNEWGAPTMVRLGELDFSTENDDSVHADFNIRNIVVHDKYKYPQKYYDIALIQLSSKTKITKYIRPACLYAKHPVEQAQALATGWGKTDYAAARSDKLMKVALNIYSNALCEQTYPVHKKQLPQGITSNMVCAGEVKGDRDTCQGDSGGPILVTEEGNHCKFYIVGITSFGKSCGQVNTPAVYTRVSAFLSWIEKIVW